MNRNLKPSSEADIITQQYLIYLTLCEEIKLTLKDSSLLDLK